MTTPATPSLLVLERGETPDSFYLTVEPHHCVGPDDGMFLFGGVTMGAGLQALERACGRDPAWASAQYVGPAHSGDRVTLNVKRSRTGKGITVAKVGVSSPNGPVGRISAALGTGREYGEGQWRIAPDAPPPAQLPDGHHWRMKTGLHGEMEVKVAHGRYGLDRIGKPTADGRLVFWIRPKQLRIDKVFLATIADYVPTGIGNALGRHSGGRSLDNTFRLIGLGDTEWVLAEVSINAISNGLVHGDIALFADDGQLMALGSQTLVLVHHDKGE